jgi:hypothetical protein
MRGTKNPRPHACPPGSGPQVPVLKSYHTPLPTISPPRSVSPRPPARPRPCWYLPACGQTDWMPQKSQPHPRPCTPSSPLARTPLGRPGLRDARDSPRSCVWARPPNLCTRLHLLRCKRRTWSTVDIAPLTRLSGSTGRKRVRPTVAASSVGGTSTPYATSASLATTASSKRLLAESSSENHP